MERAVAQILEKAESVCGPQATALSTVSAAELIHGIYRARTDADRQRREAFVEEAFLAIAIHPLTLDIARIAGRVHGEQQEQGVTISFPDLIIGATALHLDFGLLTHNLRHFRLIPGLKVIQP